MINEQMQSRPSHWLTWIAVLACASVLSPMNIKIVIAQSDGAEIAVAPVDPGQPPSPPVAAAAPELPLASPVTPATPAEVANEVPVETSAAVAEISQETQIGDLTPSDTIARSDSAQPLSAGVRTLSVEPGSHPILPADRPNWVGASPDLSSAQHYLYVGSLPALNKSDADEALDEPLVAAVRNYIDQDVVNQMGAATKMPVNAAFIRKNLIDAPEGYVCELTTSQGSMFQKWVIVRVTPEQRELFLQWHTEALQRVRLAPLGLGLVSVLSLVSLSHMVLRRRHGTISLPQVNQIATDRPVAIGHSRSWTIFMVLGLAAFLLLPALLVFVFSVRTVRTHNVGPIILPPAVEYHEGKGNRVVRLPSVHSEVRVKMLDGDRTIILRD